MNLNRFFWPAVACIIVAAGALQVQSARLETQTWDEGIHISSGYAYVTRGDYRWNSEHPPLAKIMSALPLTRMGLRIATDKPGWSKRDGVRFGVEFLYENRATADAILFAARSMTILLFLLFVAAAAWWTRRRFGAAAGLLAAVLCAFDPNLIAHGHYVTTDVPLTAFYFLACCLWVDYLENGRRGNLAAAALAFAVAMTVKFSAVLLIPTFAALYAIRWVQRPREFPLRRAGLAAAAVAGALFVVVNIVYWPETVRCATTKVELLRKVAHRNNFTGKALYFAGRSLHLPAHAYLTGLDKVASHNAVGHDSYLLGLRSEKGWWYYFPVVFGVKSTVAALVCAAGLLACLRPRKPGERHFIWMGLLFPPVFYFLFSMNSGINIGMRHILPIYPFLYVAAAGMLARLDFRRAARWAMVALGALQIGECASIAPNYLAFFNAPSGGPGNGPRYLVDSNIDWGQDVKKLRAWLAARGTREAWICYFGNVQLGYYGLIDKSPPAGLDRQGWDKVGGYVVANVTPLNGGYVPLIDLAQLRLREPIAKIGWSMYVYDFGKKPAPPAPATR